MSKPKQTDLFSTYFVDSFAGGGGASTGIERATGHPIDIAINHDQSAILMHKRNHPYTQHYREDVFAIDPVSACAGHPVRLAWFSPDYIIDVDPYGQPISRADQVARCGNAVCPPLAEALVRANLPECPARRFETMKELYDAV